jgi:ribosomal-protein-alanine N-acetyltransferase
MSVAIEPLETNRLLLRPLREEDSVRTQLLFPHWEVLKYMARVIPWPYPEDGALEFARRVLPKVEAGEEYYWAILLRENPEIGLIGVIGLTPNSDTDHRGFWLAQEYWRQGYMREASDAVTDFAFDRLDMKLLKLNNARPNLASHRLKESAGATIVTIEDGGEYVAGDFPTVRWELTAEAWRSRQR